MLVVFMMKESTRAKQGGVTSDASADVDDVLEYLHLQSSKKDLKATFGLKRLNCGGRRDTKRDLRVAKGYFMQVAHEYWSENGKTKKDVPHGTEKLASQSAGYLGRLFLRGEDSGQSFSKAKVWYARGLANGHAICQYSLGLTHVEGLGVPRDTVKAADFFAAAADSDLAVAQTNLGCSSWIKVMCLQPVTKPASDVGRCCDTANVRPAGGGMVMYDLLSWRT
ncbi:ERAD-associated protein [Elasticomyces elasticus]|nr:ERAD-associated protein [Elasticomyces elasticus]KAK5741563.1 ERAD-associated protein [Elasticomyces elasticus]